MISDNVLLFSSILQGYVLGGGTMTNFSAPDKVRFYY